MPTYKYPDFLDVVRKRTFAPVVFFVGQEDFLADECIDAIISQTLDDGTRSFNLDVVYGGKADARDVIAHASSFPMMSERRVVVVKDFDRLVSTETARSIVDSYLNKPLVSTVFLLAAEKADMRVKFYKDLKGKCDTVECKPLYADKVPAWTAERFKRKGRIADPEACQLLTAYVGTSLRAIQNEVEKVLIAVGDKPQVTVDDIASVVGVSRGYTVFDLQHAIGRKDLSEAIKIVRRMLELGESPVPIIAMLTHFFAKVWVTQELRQQRADSGAIAAALQISPFFVKEYVAASSAFSSADIEHAFGALLLADVQLKTSMIDPKVGLELLVYSLIKGTPAPLPARG